MDAWRLCRKKHLSTALSGIGAEKAGGRWNHKGLRMVYASRTLSLAALELFVHVEPHDAPADWISIHISIPPESSRETVTVARLQKTIVEPGTHWRSHPGPSVLQDFGSRWIEEKRSLILLVPSAVNPEEKNVLINPLHPEFHKLKVTRSQPFEFDTRMWK